jgi:RNA polymerase sigma factor (sigma-70 family)
MAVGQLSTFFQQLRSLFLKQDATGVTDESLLEGYLSRRDEAAFEALVRRHGPMVLGVCRRILGNAHDAEDAFQATFLVLVRKATAIRPRSMVGNWLYGVARRTSLEARRTAAKRRTKEAAVLPRAHPPDDDSTDLRAVLDEELQRLPTKCRAVIILSDLEGKTRKEVALQLGWPEGTVASRLARARARLAKRLARYGLAVSGGFVGALLPEGAASASVPTPLVVSTVKAASLLAAGQAVAGTIPAQVAALMEGTLKAMLLNKVLKTTTLLLAVVALGTVSLYGYTAGFSTIDRAGRVAETKPQGVHADDRPVAPGGVLQGKAAPNERDVSKEIAKLMGVWVCVGYERDGEAHLDQQAREAMWNETLWFHPGTPKDDPLNISWETKGRQTSALSAITLRPATSPQAIDLTWKSIPARDYMPKGIDPAWEQATWNEAKLDRVQPGIYSIEGNRLRMCWGELGGERPTSLETKRGDKLTIHLYERKPE